MNNSHKLSIVPTLPPPKVKKETTAKAYAKLLKEIAELQNRLFAQGKYAVLIVLQGMDTSGKDSAVRHVFSGVNPAGCTVKSFKAPTEEEKAHHFLWRISKECPPKGMIQIFNRSHYEDILVPFVNGSLGENELVDRCKQINVFENGLIKDNTIVIKFFLHISQKEQYKRLATRINNPKKQWKYQKQDHIDIEKHDKYEEAYEFVFSKGKGLKPWYIIPADKKWFKNYSILKIIVNTLKRYEISYPLLENRHTETA